MTNDTTDTVPGELAPSDPVTPALAPRAPSGRSRFWPIDWRRSLTGSELELPGAGSWRFAFVVLLVAVLAEIFIGAFGRYYMSVFSVGCGYLVAALGYNVVLGYNGQLSFGHAGFLAISSYGFAVMEQAGYSSWISAIVGVAASVVAALLLGLAVIRARHFYLALITLAFAQAVILVIERWHAQTHGDDGISVDLNGRNTVYVAIAVAAIALLLVDRLVRSRFGRAMVMVRSDERVAEAMGVPTAWTRMAAAAIAGGLGGVGGILLSGSLGYITPQNFSIDLTVLLLTMIVVGGLGSMWGTIIGAIGIVILNQIIANSQGWSDIIYGLVLFAALALLPGGIVSLPQRLLVGWAKLRTTIRRPS